MDTKKKESKMGILSRITKKLDKTLEKKSKENCCGKSSCGCK